MQATHAPSWTTRLGPLPASAAGVTGFVAAKPGEVDSWWPAAAVLLFVALLAVSVGYSGLKPYPELSTRARCGQHRVRDLPPDIRRTGRGHCCQLEAAAERTRSHAGRIGTAGGGLATQRPAPTRRSCSSGPVCSATDGREPAVSEWPGRRARTSQPAVADDLRAPSSSVLLLNDRSARGRR